MSNLDGNVVGIEVKSWRQAGRKENCTAGISRSGIYEVMEQTAVTTGRSEPACQFLVKNSELDIIYSPFTPSSWGSVTQEWPDFDW